VNVLDWAAAADAKITVTVNTAAVILSAAKDLRLTGTQIPRCARDDKTVTRDDMSCAIISASVEAQAAPWQ